MLYISQPRQKYSSPFFNISSYFLMPKLDGKL